MPRLTAAALLTSCVLLAGLSSCSRAHPTAAPTRTSITTSTVPSTEPTAPVAAGPTTSVTGVCPLVSTRDAANNIGQRLDHVRVQRSGGRVVGCEFYPITAGLAGSEHLPRNGYPSARITVTSYPSAATALQALVDAARAGGAPVRVSIRGLTGETFATRFYPPDGDDDTACAFVSGPLLVTVLVADAPSDSGQTNAVDLATAIAPRL